MPTAPELQSPPTETEPELPLVQRESSRLDSIVVGGLLALGMALRLVQYLSDRPLWYDEAMLANNVLSRSFIALAGTLDESQVAPLGFLWLVKSATVMFGTSELALRLVPLLMSLAALVVFWSIAERALPRLATLVALAMFAVSPRLIYYAAEVKQYSTDVAAGLALLLIGIEARKRGYPVKWLACLAGAGAVAVWLSQPSVFVVAGVFIAVGLDLALQRDLRKLGAVAAAGLACGLSFAISYTLARSSMAGSHVMPTFWAAGFLPLPPTSSAELLVWAEAFSRPFRDPLMYAVPLGGVVLYLVGLVALARWREPFLLVLLTSPVVLTMLAAGLHLYPYGDDILYGGRVLLFLAPVLLLTIAAGAELARRWLRVRPVTFAVIAGILIVTPRAASGTIADLQQKIPVLRTHLSAPPLPPMRMEWQDPRPLLIEMAEHTRPDDLIYVYDIAGPPFRYYAPRLGVAGQWVRGGASGGDPEPAAAEIEMLRGYPRAWLFFAYAHGNRHVPFVEHANRIGEPLMVLEHDGTAAVLYDFSSR